MSSDCVCTCWSNTKGLSSVRLSGSPRRTRTSRSAGNPRNSGETETTPTVSHNIHTVIIMCKSLYLFHTEHLSHVLLYFCIFQGMSGPQGPLGPPGEKVRNQPYKHTKCKQCRKLDHVCLLWAIVHVTSGPRGPLPSEVGQLKTQQSSDPPDKNATNQTWTQNILK